MRTNDGPLHARNAHVVVKKDSQVEILAGKVFVTLEESKSGINLAGCGKIRKLCNEAAHSTSNALTRSTAHMADTIPSQAELLPLESERFHTAYQDYFKRKRGNFFRSITEFKGLWDGLQLLNDIWMRGFSDLERLGDQYHLLPKLIFSGAHARFLTAIELGFSCCIGDAYSVPQVIESTHLKPPI